MNRFPPTELELSPPPAPRPAQRATAAAPPVAPPRPNLARPVLQTVVMREAESFVCRRCRSNHTVSHEAFDSPYHFHPEYELLLIENSRGTRYVADSIEPYGPGDLFFIGGNVPHVFVRQHPREPSAAPETSICVAFRGDFLGEGFLARPEMVPIRNLFAASLHGLQYDRPTATWVSARLRKLLTAQSVARVTLLLDILARLARSRARPLASGAVAKQIELKDYSRLDRVLTFISQNFPHEVDLASAARVAAMCPAAFSRWFRHATGKSFLECLTEVRLSHAFRLLTETSKNVTEIGYDCGFNSVSHFIHRFKEARGMSPGEYRRHVTAGLVQQ